MNRDSNRYPVETERLAAVVRRVYRRGWCEGTSGNYSLTVGRDPIRILITRTGIDKMSTGPEDFLIVGPDATPVGGETRRPSAEAPLHVALSRDVGAGAVLHTHSVWGTLLGEKFRKRGGFSIAGYEMIKGIEGRESHEETLFVPVLPNTQDMPGLAPRVSDLARERPDLRGFLIAGHGLYAWGTDLDQAHRHIEIFEFLFQVVGRRLGWDPFPG